MMRGLTDAEYADLRALDEDGERNFPSLDALIHLGRAREYDHDPVDGSYRVEPTELGRLAMRLWPVVRQVAT